jgi:hypothetical protein
MMSDSRKDKKDRMKYDPDTIYRAAKEHLNVSHEAVESISLGGELRYKRRVIFYLLFIHTACTVTNIREIINVPPNRINEAINEARIDIANGNRRITKDISLIINSINNQLWNKR